MGMDSSGSRLQAKSKVNYLGCHAGGRYAIRDVQSHVSKDILYGYQCTTCKNQSVIWQCVQYKGDKFEQVLSSGVN